MDDLNGDIFLNENTLDGGRWRRWTMWQDGSLPIMTCSLMVQELSGRMD